MDLDKSVDIFKPTSKPKKTSTVEVALITLLFVGLISAAFGFIFMFIFKENPWWALIAVFGSIGLIIALDQLSDNSTNQDKNEN